MGTITDSYDIYPDSGNYAYGVIVEPASATLENIGPGMTATIVISVTAQPWAGGGVSDIVHASACPETTPTGWRNRPPTTSSSATPPAPLRGSERV